ncbi:MAG: hypothetical protein ACXIUD_11075 [Mongoliitalea sp.]
MICNYNKLSILSPLENGESHIFMEIKIQMRGLINEGHQIKIISQIEGFPIEDEEMLSAIQDIDTWFEAYGF